ncbi:hypothetical protein D3C87_1794590 [compost metagenome]
MHDARLVFVFGVEADFFFTYNRLGKACKHFPGAYFYKNTGAVFIHLPHFFRETHRSHEVVGEAFLNGFRRNRIGRRGGIRPHCNSRFIERYVA